jgi:hypothetical protein
MASEIRSWTRQGEAFWRAHHQAEGIPFKLLATGGLSSKRRRGLSPPLSPLLSPPPIESPDLSLLVVGRSHCCATARGSSTTV